MEWNWIHLAAFRAVVTERSFTRGAALLGVSQPAVSKQVAELERGLGVALIERGRRAAVPTHAGEVLLEHVRRADDALASAKNALADLSAMRRGRLRIGATPTVGTYLLPRALVYFRTRFPAIDVTAEVASASTLGPRLRGGRLDVVLSASVARGRGVSAAAFMNDTTHAVCAPDHPWAGRRTASLHEFANERLIVRSGRGGRVGWAERMLRTRGCEPKTVLRLPTTEAVKQAALAGLGVAFLPGMAVSDDVRSGRLCVVRVAGFVLARPYHWSERTLRDRPSAVRAFECVLKHAVRGSLPKPRK